MTLDDECLLSWQEQLTIARQRPPHARNIVDDGFYSRMAVGARFEGVFEFPVIHPCGLQELPTGAIPFSKLDESTPTDCVVFFENDPLFADVLVAADDYIDALGRCSYVASPDCSIYRDEPLAVQIANTYLNRLVGHCFQHHGLNVIPTVRWGDERSYSTVLFAEPFAFVGLPKRRIYWIGSYGNCRKPEDRFHFKRGLEAMMDFLEPEIVLCYGAMSEEVFGRYRGKALFIQYPDWVSRKKRRL